MFEVLEDESGQTSAELLLVIGGMIVIAIFMLLMYKNYVTGLGNEVNNTDAKDLSNKISKLKDDFT
mgnify:FL=1|jgi:hypothetical protein